METTLTKPDSKKEVPQNDSLNEKKASRKKNGSQSLLQVKHQLDKVIPNLASYPELKKEAVSLREKIFNLYIDEERKSLEI